MRGVYLLHFMTPYHHAQHYIGYASNIPKRVEMHRSGKGARLTQVVTDAGIGILLVRYWQNQGKDFERQLKNRKNAKRYCPICKKRH